jgi:transposase
VRIDPDALPDDPAQLQQMLRSVLHQQGAIAAENDKLRLLIQRLMRHQFGRRSEQLSADQLQLGLEDVEQAVAENEAGHEAVARARLTAANRLSAIWARYRRPCRAMRS